MNCRSCVIIHARDTTIIYGLYIGLPIDVLFCVNICARIWVGMRLTHAPTDFYWLADEDMYIVQVCASTLKLSRLYVRAVRLQRKCHKVPTP